MKRLSPPRLEVHAAAVSHPPGLGETIHQHLPRVWRYLRMHGADAHAADDLAQEAFVIAIRKGALGFAPAATATFLRRTARFLFLRRCRDRRRAIELADHVDELWARDSAADAGDDLLVRLRACVERLPERSRRAVELSYGLGSARSSTDDTSTRTAVAQVLGLQENGLKTLLQRVRQQLRTCIERSEP